MSRKENSLEDAAIDSIMLGKLDAGFSPYISQELPTD
jgi:hypothetical protein